MIYKKSDKSDTEEWVKFFYGHSLCNSVFAPNITARKMSWRKNTKWFEPSDGSDDNGILNETFYLLVPGALKKTILTAAVFICIKNFVFCGV